MKVFYIQEFECNAEHLFDHNIRLFSSREEAEKALKESDEMEKARILKAGYEWEERDAPSSWLKIFETDQKWIDAYRNSMKLGGQ